ncbi:MAG: hypothetical protein Q9227_003349 [Pyrenula ochraceoflavens]
MAASSPYSIPRASHGGNPIYLPDGSVLYPSPFSNGTHRDVRSMVMKFNDSAYQDVLEFDYRRLSDLKKRIRLLRLRSGHLRNPEIDCELFEAEYDDNHNLREIKDERVIIESEPVQYEALSWCWGTEETDCAIIIRFQDRRPYKKKVSKELALALKYLRNADAERTLWIDALCINQADYEERNHQVQMMSLIYTQATQVCVWLGEDTDESQLAIRFINDEIMKLENFDDVCSNNKNAEKWQALVELMQRPWFSRRWVVQEIALANRATVYCGGDMIPWTSFAVAVELFVEVETATHRLSEIMQRNERFRYVPNWFEYVSELGASLLVSATAKIFRQYKSPADATRIDTKRGLLSLEYLVSTLFIFEATVPHDAVYSLLAIAKDTSPIAKFPIAEMKDQDALLHASFGDFMERKPYTVDYHRSYADVCKDFVSFCIERSSQLDPARGLDILCRPWAPAVPVKSGKVSSSGRPGFTKPKDRRMRARKEGRDKFEVLRRPSFKRSNKRVKLITEKDVSESTITKDRQVVTEPRQTNGLRKSTANENVEKSPLYKRSTSSLSEKGIGAKNKGDLGYKDSLVIRASGDQDADLSLLQDSHSGTPVSHEQINTDSDTSANVRESTQRLDEISLHNAERLNLEADPRDTETYFKDSIQKHGDVSENILRRFPKVTSNFESARTGSGDRNSPKTDTNSHREAEEIDLPSWIARIDNAPFGLFTNPGMHLEKMGRRNADPLVSLPEDGHRNYSAAQSKSPCLKTLKFRKRPRFGTYSLYVKGFILDEIQEVAPYSQGGAIPKDWFTLGRWDAVLNQSQNSSKARSGEEHGPPPEFWRTLVADRGKDNRNPPYYYAKACEECVNKGSLSSGRVNVEALINNERNSIIAEFCRRVQAVIWNRKMIRTKRGALGLVSQYVEAGDLVCIIYGCTTPVILRRRELKDRQIVEDEAEEDNCETLKTLILRSEDNRIRKVFYGSSDKESDEVKELSTRLLTESVNLMKKQITSWKDARKYAEDLDKISKDRRNLVSEAWAKLQEAQGKNREVKDESVERLKEPPSMRHLDETSRIALAAIIDEYQSQSKTVDDRLKIVDLETWTFLDEQTKIRIRDLHSSYQFMGESYIHGMMDGEAIREQYEDSIPEHIFELR